MANTYRLTLLYVRDDTLHEPIERKRLTRKMRRKRDRKAHRLITRDAVRDFYSEREDRFDELDSYDDYRMMQMIGDIEDAELDRYMNEGRDYADDYADDYGDAPYDDTDYGNDWGSYYDPWDFTRSEQPEDRIIKPEDAGKTLAEILQEIEDRR